MATSILIHAGDDVNVVIPLESIAAGMTHADYLDVKAFLVDTRNNTLARFSKVDTGTEFNQWIQEYDTVVEGETVYRIVIPLDNSITSVLARGEYFLKVGFEFADSVLPDGVRFQSDTQLQIIIVGDKEPTDDFSEIVVEYGINAGIGGAGQDITNIDGGNSADIYTF